MSDRNVLPWSSERLLDWSDFQAESNPAVFEDAYSVVKCRCVWTVKSETFGSDIRFSIGNIRLIPEFYKQLSWVRSNMATPKLLNHEQGHFDLVELLRAELTEKIQAVFDDKWYPTRGQNDEQRKQFAREDSGTMLTKELEKWEKYVSKKQHDYDVQTDYGQITEEQDKYNVMFARLHK